jgi:hypothetical protein
MKFCTNAQASSIRSSHGVVCHGETTPRDSPLPLRERGQG